MTPRKYNSVEEMVDDLSESDEFKRSFRLTVQNKILRDALKIIGNEDSLEADHLIALEALKQADDTPSEEIKDGLIEDDIKWIKETDKGVKRYFSAQGDSSTMQTDDKEAEVFRRLRMAVSKLKKICGME